MKFIYLLILSVLPFLSYTQTYSDFIEKSYEYLEKEEYKAAEESLRAAMRLEPANPHNYALLGNLGTIQRMQGNQEEALLSYTAALSRNPESVLILESRASLYTELGDIEKAIFDYNSLLGVNPDHQDALYNRGILYLQQLELLRAEADFERLLELNDKTIKGRLGYAILEKMRENYDESERIYNYLIRELPKEWPLYESRADLYFKMGKNARAMADMNKVFSEGEPTAVSYVLRGRIKLAQYEKASARNDFLKAEEMGYNKEIIQELLLLTKERKNIHYNNN